MMNIKEEYPEIPGLLLYAMVGVVGADATLEILECYSETKDDRESLREGKHEKGEEEE